ncbi:hypothetical protein [Saccharothrix yanglingensis]|nr:hypothetical protein [Saccharothrix yanglingensis]
MTDERAGDRGPGLAVTVVLLVRARARRAALRRKREPADADLR